MAGTPDKILSESKEIRKAFNFEHAPSSFNMAAFFGRLLEQTNETPFSV